MNNDPISRQAALDIIDAELDGWLTDDERLHLEGVGAGIACLPTIDHVKHGKWLRRIGTGNVALMQCSECMFRYPEVLGVFGFHYCPSCGAKMDKEKDDATD